MATESRMKSELQRSRGGTGLVVLGLIIMGSKVWAQRMRLTDWDPKFGARRLVWACRFALSKVNAFTSSALYIK